MVSVEEKVKKGEKINDPKVGRYVMMMGPLIDALRSITGQDFKSYKKWKEWWDGAKDKFKVKE